MVATEHGIDRLIRHGWDERALTRLFEVSLAPPTLGEIRDEIPEIASQILLHFVEAGEVPPAASARRPSRAAQPQLERRLRRAEGRHQVPRPGYLEEEIGMDEVAHLLVKTPTAALGLPLDLPLRGRRRSSRRLYFEHHLQIDGSNMTRLAEKTGLERTHLYRKLKQLGISVGKRHDNGDG